MENYENRFVAFIDILGFKELIRRSENDSAILDRLLEVLAQFSELIDIRKKISGEDSSVWTYQVSTFSDNVVISTRQTKEGLIFLLLVATLLSTRLLQKGIFTRGAISSGKLIHTDKIVLGNGLIKAYQLESGTAIYPRIIVDDEIVSMNPEIKNRVRRDFDGLWHLHVFHKAINSIVAYTEGFEGGAITEEYLSAARREIEHSIEDAPTLAVKAKITWLAKYFNENAEALGLASIPIQEGGAVA